MGVASTSQHLPILLCCQSRYLLSVAWGGRERGGGGERERERERETKREVER